LTKEEERDLEDALNIIKEKCSQDHITLEVLVSLISFRSGDKLDTDSMWESLCNDCPVNEFSHIVALLVKLGCIGKILTSNFDHMLEDACRNVGADFQVVTNVQLEENDLSFFQNSTLTQICPFHGTTFVDPLGDEKYTAPFTATATGLAKPFSRKMAEYIEDALGNVERPIIVFGYSGSDHFELNPLLSSLHLDQTENREHWHWIIHSGNKNYCSQAVKNIFGATDCHALLDSNAFCGAVTPVLMRQAFEYVTQSLGSDILSTLPMLQNSDKSRSTYEERLEGWFQTNFVWNTSEARNMVLDLKDNLPAAWIVSEHYRLIQMGFDEEYSFRFAGIFGIDSTSRSVGKYPHLTLKFGLKDGSEKEAEFGYILEAARIYRLEMNDPDQLFPVTTYAMKRFIETATDIVNLSPRKDTEMAALHLGLAIGYDYLGLIGGRHVTKLLKEIKQLQHTHHDVTDTTYTVKMTRLQEQLKSARLEASMGFEKCIEYATKAKQEMAPELNKLIPALTWIQVGLDNMGRFKIPGSDEALDWLTRAIYGRKALIDNEVQQSIDHGETDLATSKLVSIDMHYPPLWRRGGELVQQVLETHGFNSAPSKLITDLNEKKQRLLEFGFEISEEAYKKYRQMTKTNNLNFPAVFDARVLMALAKNDIQLARKEVERCRETLHEIPEHEFTASKLQSTAAWIDNIQGRIDDFIFRFGNANISSDITRDSASKYTNFQLISYLKVHLEALGKTGVKGFHHMDANDNKRISAKELVKEFHRAGHQDITLSHVQRLMEGYVRPGGEMDVAGFLRLLNRYD
jgi:hypothetical protein